MTWNDHFSPPASSEPDFAGHVLQELRRLLTLKGRTSVSRDDAERWAESLDRSNVSLADFQKGVDQWLDHEIWFPAPAELIGRIANSRTQPTRRHRMSEKELQEHFAKLDELWRVDPRNPANDPLGDDWPEHDGIPPAWLRRLAARNKLCSEATAKDPERVLQVPAIAWLNTIYQRQNR